MQPSASSVNLEKNGCKVHARGEGGPSPVLSKILAIVAGTVVLDQASKFLIERTMSLGDSIHVMGSFLRLTYIHNPNAAFGIGLGGSTIHMVFSLVAFGLILYILYRTPPGQKGVQAALALILGGAIGNLIDRVRMGEVIDFIDVGVRKYRWPVFNVADSVVTIGALMLVFLYILDRDAHTRASDRPGGDGETAGSPSDGA